MSQIIVIGTDPQYGHNVMHSAAQPWAVAEVEFRADGTKHVARIFTRHATWKGAKISSGCAWPGRQPAARQSASSARSRCPTAAKQPPPSRPARETDAGLRGANQPRR